MTKEDNERYIEMREHMRDSSIVFEEIIWEEVKRWNINTGDDECVISNEIAYAIIEADIRNQLISAGWSLMCNIEKLIDTTIYSVSKSTLEGTKHRSSFTDYAEALLYAIKKERELYGDVQPEHKKLTPPVRRRETWNLY